ncbi:MAG: ribulose-phosphate 3-epimerase, partial [Anaerolineaceae bacterium]
NPNVMRTLQEIRDLGCKAGLALNPGTSELALRPVIDLLDLVLILTVNPGFSGQSFMPEVKYKIAEVRKMIDTWHPGMDLEVDGGIHHANIREVLDLGASVIVSASAIFKNPAGIAGSISLLKEAAR